MFGIFHFIKIDFFPKILGGGGVYAWFAPQPAPMSGTQAAKD
jgi:hypothetical protein